jgi:hypothetical protein
MPRVIILAAAPRQVFHFKHCECRGWFVKLLQALGLMGHHYCGNAFADLGVGDTAGLEACATSRPSGRLVAVSGCARHVPPANRDKTTPKRLKARKK